MSLWEAEPGAHVPAGAVERWLESQSPVSPPLPPPPPSERAPTALAHSAAAAASTLAQPVSNSQRSIAAALAARRGPRPGLPPPPPSDLLSDPTPPPSFPNGGEPTSPPAVATAWGRSQPMSSSFARAVDTASVVSSIPSPPLTARTGISTTDATPFRLAAAEDASDSESERGAPLQPAALPSRPKPADSSSSKRIVGNADVVLAEIKRALDVRAGSKHTGQPAPSTANDVDDTSSMGAEKADLMATKVGSTACELVDDEQDDAADSSSRLVLRVRYVGPSSHNYSDYRPRTVSSTYASADRQRSLQTPSPSPRLPRATSTSSNSSSFEAAALNDRGAALLTRLRSIDHKPSAYPNGMRESASPRFASLGNAPAETASSATPSPRSQPRRLFKWEQDDHLEEQGPPDDGTVRRVHSARLVERLRELKERRETSTAPATQSPWHSRHY